MYGGSTESHNNALKFVYIVGKRKLNNRPISGPLCIKISSNHSVNIFSFFFTIYNIYIVYPSCTYTQKSGLLRTKIFSKEKIISPLVHRFAFCLYHCPK